MNNSYNKKNINKDIFTLMIPVVLENILQLLAGLVTTAMVGRLLADEISAAGMSLRLYQTTYAIFRGLGMGATVAVALYFGKKELGKCRRIIEQAYLTAMPLALLSVTLILLFPGQILSIFTPDKTLIQIAVDYSRILVWATPFMALICFNTAAFNGQGNTKVPMFIAIVLNIVNICAGYVFIFGFRGIGGWGVNGAAAATVISQFVGAVMGLFLLYNKKGPFKLASHGQKFFSLDINKIKTLYAAGIPAAMEYEFWQLSAIIMSKVILGYGSNYYAAFQLGLQAELLTELPADGFVVASVTLSSQAIGRRDPELFRAYCRQLIKMAILVGVLATAALFLFPHHFMRFLTDKPDLQQIGAGYVFMMGFSQMAQVLTKVFNGIIRASGGKKVPMFITFIGIWIIRVPAALLVGLILKLDIQYIWIIIVTDQISRMLMGLFYIRRKDTLHYIDRLNEADANAAQ